MAHAIRLGELAGELITRITGRTLRSHDFKALKENTIKGLRDQSHARTNQFAVRKSLDGLIEKFAVRNCDGLAEALQDRLDELPADYRWLPEILSLLLQLSDKPVENVDVDALNLGTRTRDTEAELTWDQIPADGPLDEEGVWDDIDHGYHSSGDDAVGEEAESDHTTSTQATSVTGNVELLARSHLQQPDITPLDEIRNARVKSKQLGASNEQQSLSELKIAREILNVMRGLPTSVFDIDERSSRFLVRSNVRSLTTSSLVLHDLLITRADEASKLYALRKWCKSDRNAAHVQSMQAALAGLLQDCDDSLAQMEQNFVKPLDGTVLSIIDVCANIEALVDPLVHLSTIVSQVETAVAPLASPFALMDALYEEVCVAHVSDDVQLFDAASRVLFAGLNTYLAPVATWTRTGTLPKTEAQTFFVKTADEECALGNVWQRRWALRRQENNTPFAPHFMQSFVTRAFGTGKAKAFANILAPVDDFGRAVISFDKHIVSFEEIGARLSSNSLTPIPQLVEDVISNAISSVGDNGDLGICRQLLFQHGFLQLLRAMPYVFFSKDGTLFQSFAETLFGQLQRHKLSSERSRFLLTELAQFTIGSAPDVDANSITINISNEQAMSTTSSILNRLALVTMHLALTWPAQTIVRAPRLHTLPEIFTLLLQFSYARSILRPQFFALRRLDSRSKDLDTRSCTVLKLRSHLLWFIDIFHEHIMTTATALHRQMCSQMENATGIDAMSSIWSVYTARLSVTMFLAHNLGPIKSAILETLQDCEQFGALWHRLTPPLPERSQSSPVSGPDRTQEGSDAVETMLQDFKRTLAFTKAGLRSVSRTSGETALEALADRLDWECG